MIFALLHKMGVIRGCWLRDFDGEVVARILRTDAWGRHRAKRWNHRSVELHADGTTSGVSYVSQWKAMP